jgi:hypothetical protein
VLETGDKPSDETKEVILQVAHKLAKEFNA